jgi:hypothetical protein
MIKLIFLIYFTLTSISYAYLDPGTGSIILQVIIGFVAALFSWLFIFWTKVKIFFNKIKNFFLKKKNN